MTEEFGIPLEKEKLWQYPMWCM